MRGVARRAVTGALLALFALVATSSFLIAGSLRPDPPPLDAARAHLASADSYALSSRVTQRLTPLAIPALVGQGDQLLQFQIDGAVTPGGARYLFRAADSLAAPVALVEEGGQLFVERDGAREPVANPAGSLPTLSPLAYLAAAEEVRPLEPSADGSRGYAFTISGPRLAHSLGSGAPPAQRSAAALLQRISGAGELYLRADGMPERQALTLHIPDLAGSYRATIQVETRFSAIVAPSTPASPLDLVAGLAQPLGALASLQGALTLIALAGAPLLFLILRRSRRAAALLSLTVAALLATSPALTVPALAAPQASLAEAIAAPPPEGAAPAAAMPQQAQPPVAPAAGPRCGDGTPGADIDQDGLTDQQEHCLGTDPYRADTDQDGIDDDTEVRGLSFAGQSWPTDPLSPDSNRDGQLDTAEWPAPAGAASGADLDGDGTPNPWDDDDDGDGVRDEIDLSPASRSGQVEQFTVSTSGDGYAGYQYIELQVRPSNPERMRYTAGALDWPYDSEGQIQDLDSSPEDLRLVPMLEVRASQTPDPALAARYNATIISRDGDTFLYLPLSPVRADGLTSALSARIAYGPGQSSSVRLEARMVWLVNGALDRQTYGGRFLNESTVIQVYPEPTFQVTGLQINLSSDFESVLLATPGQSDHRHLFQLLYGWQSAVLGAQRIDGQSVTRTAHEEAIFRLTSPNTPVEQRFGLPPQVSVVADLRRYAHVDEAIGDLSSGRISAFLNARGYQPGSRPALAIAYQEQSGSYGLDDLGSLDPGDSFSVGLSSIRRNLMRGVKLGLYVNEGGWRQLSPIEAAQVGAETDVAADLAGLSARYPAISALDLRTLLSTLYYSWSEGQSRPIATDGTPIAPESLANAEIAAGLTSAETGEAAYLVELLQLGAPGGGLRIGGSLAADYSYQRAARPAGYTLPGVSSEAFRMTKNSTVIAGEEIPRLSLGPLLSLYGRFKAIQTLSHFVKDGKKFTEWFKLNKSWSKLGTFGKVTKLIGPTLEITMAWVEFGLTTDFSNPKAIGAAVTLAIVTTAIAIALFAVSLNPVGAVLAALLSLIDLILYLTSGQTLSGRIAKAIAEFFYDYNILTQLDSADFRQTDSDFANPDRGVIVGNKFIVTSSFIGTVSRTSDGSRRDLERSSVSGAFDPTDSPGVQSAPANRGAICAIEADDAVKVCINAAGAEYLLIAPRINALVSFTGRVRSVTRTEECILGFCDKDTQTDDLPEDRTPTEIYLDVLPDNLDDLWAWGALTNPDPDGDGLGAGQEQQIGSSPTDADSDDDGLSDAFELQRGTSATSADSDADGLADGLELRYGTSPLQPDSDADGLADGDEARRYEGGQWLGGWQVSLPGGRAAFIFASPTLGDIDGDALRDGAEQAGASSPFAANLGPALDLRVTPAVAGPDGRFGTFARPGDQVRIDLSLINGGGTPISSALELCVPLMFIGISGGDLFGARRPATSFFSCGGRQGYRWSFSGADTLQVGELVTATITGRIDPGIGLTVAGTVSARLPYTSGVEADLGATSRTAYAERRIVADYDTPTITLGGVEDGALLRGASLVLGGAASDPSSWVTGVEISTDGGATYQPASLAANEWAYAWPLPADGTYRLIARATDYLGRRASTAPISVRVDNTTPSVTPGFAANAVLRPAPGGATVALSGSAGDNLAGVAAVQISIDGKPWRDVPLATPGAPASSWSYDWRLPGGPAAQGRHTIALRAVDRAGNLGAVTARTIVVDLVPPTDELVTGDFRAATPPPVQVGVPTLLSGRADDAGNAPRPARPQPLSGSLDALQSATVWLMPDAAAEVGPTSRVSWLGDLDGDGKGDLAVGLPDGAGGAGRVVVVYGRGGDWPATPDVEALAQSGSSFVGRPGAAIGGLIAPAGDTNADGFFDLLIGDPAGDTAYLIVGRDGGLGREQPLDGSQAAGQVRIDAPGLSTLASAGDVNGDGSDDLLVGFGGQLALVLGRDGAWPEQVAPAREAAATLSLPAGAVATGVGDVNGDGRDDFAVGDPASGALSVYLGRADLASGLPIALAAGATYSGFGGPGQIVALGRVNAGGAGDFAYTTAGLPQLVLDGGSAAPLSYTGVSGGFLAAPGDVDADGYADILLGAPGDQSARLISGQSRGELATLAGVIAAASAPYAAGADLNCDASSDLLLIPTAAPADAPPESERVLDPAGFIAPGRLPGASITSVPPAPDLPAGARVVDDDFCATCANDGLIWNVTAFNSIQSAITTSGSVTSIQVRPGVYGAFSIGSARSGLAVVGANPDAVIVDGAAGAYAAQVSGATGVRLAGLTLRNATRGVDLVGAGVGGHTNSALRTTLDRLVIHGFTNAVRMTRTSTVDVTRSTIAGSSTSGSYIAVEATPDSAVLPSWSAAGINNVNVAMGTNAHLFAEGSDIYAVAGATGGEIRYYNPGIGIWGVRVSGLPAGARGAGGGDGNAYVVQGFLPAPGSVRAIASDGTNIYVAGDFSYAEHNGAAVPISSIARWDGSSWNAMGGGPNAPGERISSMAVMGGQLYVATTPTSGVFGGPCCGVFRWDNPNWTRILSSVSVTTSSGDPNASILAMTTDGSRLYVAGNFDYYDATGGGNIFMGQSGVLVWNGSTWSHAGATVEFRPITALAANPVNGDIYAGSQDGRVFRAQGGSFGTSPIIITNGSPTITSLVWDNTNGDLYVGGRFSSVQGFAGAYNNILRYNVASFTASPLGGGTNAPVHAMLRSGSLIYAAGNFTTVDGAAANDLAAWNGSAWTTYAGDVGNTAAGLIRSLAVAPGGDIVMGGDFQGTTSGGVTDPRVYDLARLTGGAWGPLAPGARGLTSSTPFTLSRFAGGNSTARALTWGDISAGSAMAGDGTSLYLLKGGASDFYRYTISADTWQRRAPLPASAAAGTAMAFVGGQLYVAVGGTNRFFSYQPGTDSWTELIASAVPFTAFAAGAGLAWDGASYLYATNGGNGNQYARYNLSTGAWEAAQAMPFQIGDGGSLVRVGTTIYASLGAASGTIGDLRRLSPVGITANKLTVSGSAFIAPGSVPAPDWIDLDASTEDFRYSTTGSQWTVASGQSWAAPGAPATVGLGAARLIDQANDVYRVDTGSALAAGYHAARPDAQVSPLYCATCANDGFTWGQTAFSSIQAAIDSGAPRVLLGPGLYREAISLVSGVQLIGAGADLSVIQAPGSDVRAVVTAEGVRGATLARVTVAGVGTGAGLPIGIVVEQGAGQVRIARSLIRNAPVGVQINDVATAAELVNNTIVGNADGVVVSGAGSAGRVDLRNTLFASNSGTALTFGNGSVLHRYNGYHQNGADVSTGAAGLGDVAGDPLFVNAAIGDYRLRDGSPMINSGNPSDPTPPGTSGRVDIGYIQRGQAAFYADAGYGPNSFNDGLDWQVDAFARVQEALDAAERSLRAVGCRADASGTCAYQITVGVGPGAYSEQLRVPSQVRLVGSGAEQTTINGGSGTAVSFAGVVNAGVSGVTITGTSTGTGVAISGAANTIRVSRAIIRGLGTGLRAGDSSSGELTFSTLVGNNLAVQADGAGSWARVQHSIVAFNSSGLSGTGGGLVFSDFTLRHNSPDGPAGVVLGDGNLSGQNPRFVNAAANNYRLQPASPALDQGAPWATAPAGGGGRADLGYAELLARPFVVLFGREGLSCAAGNSGVQGTEVGITRVSDPTLPVTATLPLSWTSAALADAGAGYSYWTANVTPATAGTYRIYTRAADVAGNQEPDAPILYSGAMLADGTAPTVTWPSLAPISTSAPAINLSAFTDDGAAADLAFEFSGGGDTFQVGAGWSNPAWQGGSRELRAGTPVPPGTYSVVAVARDLAGNVGRSAARSLTISAPVGHAATITVPSSGFTSQSSLTVTGYARFSTVDGPGTLAVSVNGGAPIQATLAEPYAQASAWSATVSLGAPGAKTITVTPANAGGSGSPASASIILDQTPPTLNLPAPSVVTGTITLSGTAADAGSGLARVDVSFDGGYTWLLASLSSGSWSRAWSAPDSPQQVSYPVRVRAYDQAGNETLRSLVLTVDTNAPTLGEVSFTIEPGTHLDTPPAATLSASWTPALDDGGAVMTYAVIDQSPSSTPASIVAGGSLSRSLNAAGAWYMHLLAVDAAGNRSIAHYGPWLVRDVGTCAVLPIAVDGVIDLEAAEWRLDRNLLDDDERPSTPQALYAALDVDSLFLGWSGARWAVDGTLYLYLNTGGSGTTAPVAASALLPALPFAADLAVAVTGASAASAWRYSAGAWQPQSLSAAQLAVAQGEAGDTEIRLSRAIAGSMANLLAVAVDAGGAPWSVFPTSNPLGGGWADSYSLAGLTSCADPIGAGQPGATSLALSVTPAQDPDQPLGPGAAVVHTLRLDSAESRAISGAQLRLSASAGLRFESLAGVSCPGCASGQSGWTIALPAIPPRGSTTLTVTGRLDAALGALTVVTDTVALDLGGAERSRAAQPQRVDGLPPTVDLDLSAGNALLPGSQPLSGAASDGAGAGVQQVEIRPQGGSWQPADGTLDWSARLSVPTQQTWSVELRATDQNGLTSAPRSYTFNVDQSAPTAALTLPALLAGSTAVITGTAEDPAPAGARVGRVEVQIGDTNAPWLPGQVYDPAGGVQGWSFSWGLPDADNAPYQLRVRAIDEAGNVGPESAWASTMVDSRPPTITVTQAISAVDLAVYPETALLGGQISDGSGVGLLQLRVFAPNGDAYLEPVDRSGATWSFTPSRPLTAGDYRLVLETGDTAGNLAQREFALRASGVAPSPLTVAISRLDPALTNAASVRFAVTFNMTVTGVLSPNLTLATAGVSGAAISGIAGGGATYTVTVDTGGGDGTIALEMRNSTGVRNIVQKPVSNLPQSSAPYTIDRTRPIATIDPVLPALRNSAVPTVTIRFSTPVSGFDLGDLALTRDSAPVALGGATLQGSGDAYELGGLAALTGAEGAYALTLAVAGSGIADGAGNAPAADAGVAFQVDTTAPTAAIGAVTPDPRNSAVPTMTITFSEPVSGLDLGDLSLSRDGGGNLLTGAESLGSVDQRTFTIGGLSTLTGATGGYALVLDPAGAGIADLAGNPLVAVASGSFTVDITNPTLDAISRLDPPLTNAASVRFALRFSEPVATLSAGNLTLETSGLSGAAISGVAGAGDTWVVTVGTGSGDGTLGLRLANSAGLSDAVGNPVSDFSTTGAAYTIDRGALLAVIAPVAPDPRNSPLASVTISFGKAVSGFDLADLALTRDGTPIALAGATLSSDDGIVWQLGGLSGLTAGEGRYTLTLTAVGSGIADGASNPLAADATAQFRVDLTAPTATINPVTPDPRNLGVAALTIRFDEAVAGLDLADLALTRDGAPLDLAGATLSSGDGIVWQLGGLSGLTTPTGAYSLTLTAAGAGIADEAGNPLAAGAARAFVVDTTPPTATILPVTPDPRSTAVVSMTILFSEAVSGFDLGDLRLTRDGAPVSLAGATLNGGGATYELGGLEQSTGASGQYQLVLSVAGAGIADLVGNAPRADASRAFVVDRDAPTASIDPVTPNPRAQGVERMTVRFSEAVSGFDLGDLRLTRDGAPIDLSGATLVSDTGGLVWELGGLRRLTQMTGRYALTLRAAGSGIADPAGNALAGDASGEFRFSEVRIFFPLMSLPPVGPDLVATVRTTPDRRSFREDEQVLVTIEVTNRGDQPAGPFWVDLMLNPRVIPTGPTLWSSVCTLEPCRGAAWQVTQTLAPGESVVLTTTPASFVGEFSDWSPYLHLATRSIYVVVDSWNGGAAIGAVRESDETNNVAAITGITVSPERGAVSPDGRQGARQPLRPRPLP